MIGFKKMMLKTFITDNVLKIGSVGYRISHGDESQDYPIATIKIAFKMPSQELNGRLEHGHVKEALATLLKDNDISCLITLPPRKEK